MNLQVKRQATVAGQQIQVTFSEKGNKILVKNFTDGDIYVGLEPGKQNTVKIPALYFQVIMIGEDLIANKTNIDTIYIIPDETSDKGIEVQMLVKE